MSVNKNAAKSAATSAGKTNINTGSTESIAPVAETATGVDVVVANAEVSTAKPATASHEVTKPTPAEPDKAKKVSETRDEFVFDLLDRCLPGNAAESWCNKVIEAVDKGEPVTISNVDGAPVLEIHHGMRYQDRDALRVLAGRLGRDLKFNVNHIVLAKFPKA